ncbi:IS3 family transposase [Candidatus Paracaedibacter symbiosus]|uniref:IS3 family transposase n=1 Tax=Candidatus Paracaedibacter symbiosus TaxID=244582 RepID=UPI0018DBCF0C
MLKGECTFFENYEDREQSKNSIFDYCFIFYNQKRIHSTLEYLCPKEFERRALSLEDSVH